MSSVTESRAAFAQRFPHIIEMLSDPNAVSSSLIEGQGGVVDAMVDDACLYGGDAKGFALRQVEEFMTKPLRLFMERPTDAGLVSPISNDLHNSIGKFLVEQGIEEIDRQVNGDTPTFLVVFGLGLGHHLEALIERTKPRWLIIVEPITDFIEQSFKTVDWPALFGAFERQGGGVEIITKLDPGEMSSAIVRYMAKKGIPYVDGSFVFTHYPFWAFAEGRNRLYEAVEFAFINRGFFEDELVMMTNAVANLTAAPFWMLEGRARLHRPELAVVVGAGPSLDEALPRLKEIRDRIVLFSAGTALRPLLRNGLVPDFHCELENVPATVGALEEAAKYGDLSQLTLIASATVDPRIPPMFREIIFFFRDAVSSTRIFGEKHHLPISGATPTCVNTAISMAAFLGFTDIALFGADCGVREGGEDHAKDTIYLDVGRYQKTGDLRKRYPVEVEGNFGGIVRTNWVYDGCRLMLAEVIRARSLNVVNGSDGAMIPGAVPRVPEAIEPAGGVIDYAAMNESLRRSLTWLMPRDMIGELDVSATADLVPAFYDDLLALLKPFEQGEPDFGAVYQAILDFFDDCGTRYGQIEAVAEGSLTAMSRIAMFFGFRVADTSLRQQLFDLVIKEFRATVERMREETQVLFGKLIACVDAGAAQHDGNERISA